SAIGVLGWIVFIKNRKSITNRTFFYFSIISILWNLSNFLVYQFDAVSISFWFIKINMFFAVWYSYFLFQFLYIFPKSRVKFTRLFKVIILISIITSLMALTPLILKEIGELTPDGQISKIINGPAIPLFGMVTAGLIIAAIIVLVKKIRRSKNIVKLQLLYVLIGTSITFTSYLIFNFLLPAIFNNPSFIQFGSVFTLPLILMTSYAIIRHRLLDIRLIILRTVTYSIVVLVVSVTVVGLALLLPEFLTASNTTRIFIAVAASIFIVLVLDPLKKMIARLTDNLFFKASIDFQKLRTKLSEVINREIDLDILLFNMSKILEKDLKIKNVSIFLATKTGGAFYRRKGHVDKQGKKISEKDQQDTEIQSQDIDDRIAHINPLIKYLKNTKDIIVLEGLERKIEDTQDESKRKELELSKEALDNLDSSVVAPVIVGNSLNAIMILGPKLSGDPYGSEELHLLQLIGPQLASALDKSRLYEEAQQFAERLKKEVAVATEDLRSVNAQLQERNQFLSALQKITRLITQTLDFKKVTQSIADSIATELGYLGGIVLFLGKDRHKLFPDAITQVPITEKVLKLLPKPFTDYYGDFQKDNNRSIKAIKEGKVQIGSSLSEFISPAVPPKFCDAIQKLVGLKTIVAVPVYSEGEVIGVIDFLLKSDPGSLKETDLATMRALANQTGIVYRNIQLYRQLQSSNKDLGEANKHLQQLDQAKSDFVSITSHQLRTPMTGIMGYLSMILQGDFGKIPKEQKKVMEGLLEESQRMIRLINLFLNVSKIESGKLQLNLEPIALEPIIEKVITMVQNASKDKKLKFEYKKPKAALPVIMGDKDKLGDIILNLTDNAIKYTDRGSVIVTSEVDGKFVHIKVKDTGRGIDPEEAKKLFSKFVRGFGIAQVHPDGSGLGLYVARRLTEAHHGKIWVESAGAGKGSTFHVQIPIASDKLAKL
ncbi:hypothetical protein IID19_04945, partial [Patescibacteria group bacterium]|nr:hypothetical protein [Patescibacteria group bacterium]